MAESRDVRARVERHLQATLARQTLIGRVMSAAAIPMVILVLIGQLDADALLIWAAVMFAEALIDLVVPRARTVAVAGGADDPGWLRSALPFYGTFGLVWGSLPLFALIGNDPDSLWLSTIVSLAILTVYVVTTAGSRLLFAVGASGVFGQLALAVWLSDRITGRLGLLTIGYAVIIVVVHDALHRSLVDSVESRFVAEDLAATLEEFMTDRDPVTQLLNRRSFIARLDEAIAVRPGEHVVVEVANVRRLTALNELYGERFGDAVIAHIGTCLGRVTPEVGFAARLSGDEFVLATFTRSAGDDAPMSIRSLAGGPFTVDDRTSTVDFAASATAPSPTAGARAEELLGEAVFALRSGRTARVGGRRSRPGEPAQARRELVDELRRGLRHAGVQPWFQPIVDARTREVVSWEALIRWQHPDLGLISPDRLLPLCDMAALDAELLEVLVVDSLAFLDRLDAAGARDHAVHVNINASDLRDRAMADTVLGALHDSRIAPERLVLELTEREILHVDHAERATLARLDTAGLHLAVDDFGTGFSSLSHLLDFPADHLKIDRRFIEHLPDDADALALVRGVVSMAHGLGLTTVAEGVETEAAARTVHVVGCDQLQGYLFAPALAPDAALEWWRSPQRQRRVGALTPPA